MSKMNDMPAKDGRNAAEPGRGREIAPAPEGAERMAARALFAPAVDIYENEKAITLLADLPGVERKDVDITLEKRTLTIKARCEAKPPEGHSLLHMEYESGDFERSFAVSDEIDGGAIGATVRDGVLTLTLPKRAPDKRRIEVAG